MTTVSSRPGLLGAILAVVIGLVITVAAAEIILRFTMPHWREFYSGRFMEKIDQPGYGRLAIGKPGFDGYFAQNNGDFRHHIKINAFGLRNDEPVAAADGRVWVVGDSMAFGWGVERDHTYSQVTAATTGVPTYNVASPGTDVCGYQALIARMPEGIRPRAVVVGLILENDILDHDCRQPPRSGPSKVSPKRRNTGIPTLTTIKHELTGVSALYNVVAVALKRLSVVNEMLIALGLVSREHRYRGAFSPDQMGPRTERTANALLRLRSMLSADVPFAVLIAPARFEIRDGDPFFAKLRQTMVAALENREIEVVDPFPDFRAAGFEPTHFRHDGHWSPLGHELAGKAAARWLQSRL